MKKGGLILAVALFIQWFLFGGCNSGSANADNNIATDSVTIAKGETLFANRCNACHNAYLDGIGPMLGGVTESQPLNWMCITIYIRKGRMIRGLSYLADVTIKGTCKIG